MGCRWGMLERVVDCFNSLLFIFTRIHSEDVEGRTTHTHTHTHTETHTRERALQHYTVNDNLH